MPSKFQRFYTQIKHESIHEREDKTMGYTTDFYGEFQLDKPLMPEHKAYLEKFSQTRRMARDARKTAKLADSIRKAVGLPVGKEGCYFVGATGMAGQDSSPDIKNYNHAPYGQPGLWCQWVPNDAGMAIEWNGVEKFYSYVEWIQYLIKHFLAPWGYTLNGEVEWKGEDSDDLGKIVITNNVVKTLKGRVTYGE